MTGRRLVRVAPRNDRSRRADRPGRGRVPRPGTPGARASPRPGTGPAPGRHRAGAGPAQGAADRRRTARSGPTGLVQLESRRKRRYPAFIDWALSKGDKSRKCKDPPHGCGGPVAIGIDQFAVSHSAWGAGACELLHLMAGGLPSDGWHLMAGGLPSDVDSSLHVTRAREADSRN